MLSLFLASLPILAEGREAALRTPGSGGSPKAICVGSIGAEPEQEIRKFLPIAAYLAKELRTEGIVEGKVVVAKSMPQMASYLREGTVDVYIDSPFPSAAVRRLSGSRFLLRRWKKGRADYRSVLFARKGNGVRGVEDLRGKVVAFEGPFSSSGYFLPKVQLIERGLRPVSKRDLSEPVGPDEVGYVFTGDDENTMVWVLRGKVAAGAMDNQSLVEKGRDRLGDLIVLQETLPVPRQIVSVRSTLPPGLVARVKGILLGMEGTPEGRGALRAFEETTRFDELSEEILAPLAASEKFLEAEFGPP